MQAETRVFVARRIVTMNISLPIATHVAVRDGRILGLGGAASAAIRRRPMGADAIGPASARPDRHRHAGDAAGSGIGATVRRRRVLNAIHRPTGVNHPLRR